MPGPAPEACPVTQRSARSTVRDLGATSVEHRVKASIDAEVLEGELVLVAVAGTVDPMLGDVPTPTLEGLDIEWSLIRSSQRAMPGSTQAPRKLWVLGGVAPAGTTGRIDASFSSAPNLVQIAAVASAHVGNVEELLAGDEAYVVEAHAHDFETSATIPMGDVDQGAQVLGVVFAGENDPAGGGRRFGVEPIGMQTVSSVYGLETSKERVTLVAQGLGTPVVEALFVDHVDGVHWLGIGLELELDDSAPPAGGETSGGDGASDDGMNDGGGAADSAGDDSGSGEDEIDEIEVDDGATTAGDDCED